MKSSARSLQVWLVSAGMSALPVAAQAGAPAPGCSGDVVPNGQVNVDDLLAVINRWGDTADTHNVTVGSGFVFNPSVINAKSGDSVHWIWQSDNHTATSGSDCSPDGAFFDASLNLFSPEFTFPIPSDFVGQIPFFCQPHCPFGMMGVINVAPFWEDVNASGGVNVDDLLGVINGWGPCR